MGKTELFTESLLQVTVEENDDSINMKWMGKSITRKPGNFITPILVDVLKKGGEKDKRIFLDFRKLDYMNSSTITPIIKVLERAKRSRARITVLYEKARKWQDLSFSALEIFQTKDQRVEIRGLG